MKLNKNIGFVAYPKLGMPSPHSGMMETPAVKIPDRYRMASVNPDRPPSGWYIAHNSFNKKPLDEPKQRMTGYVNTDSNPKTVKATQDHESQHSIFAKINQKHGRDFTRKLIEKTLSVLNPIERKTLDFINTGKQSQAQDIHGEELVAHFHNFLQDPTHREKTFGEIEQHLGKPVSEKGRQLLLKQARKAWFKIRARAETLDFPTVMKSESLQKTKGVPKFPKLGVGDNRRETELINNPKTLETKLRVMGHESAKRQYPREVYEQNWEGKAVKVPVSDTTKKYFQELERMRTADQLKEVKNSVQQGSGHPAVVGESLGNKSFALSGILRPKEFSIRPDDEGVRSKRNYPETRLVTSTREHEDLHNMLNRIEQKYGKPARRNLAQNLWHAIPAQHRPLIDKIQAHAAGNYYDQKSPSTATEEKLARMMSFLNSDVSRNRFHMAESQRDDSHDDGKFDRNVKDAHRALLAAAEVADDNWLKPNHIKAGNMPIAKSETIDHMHGWSSNFEKLKHAAKFLSGRRIEDKAVKNYLVDHDGDLGLAMLSAHGIEPNKKNLKVLYSIVRMANVQKSESLDFLNEQKVSPVHADAEETAEDINRAFSEGHVEKVKLDGKHSVGSMLARCQSGKDYLIKPGDGKNSPAMGVNEEPATQSEREVAFWHVADKLGLGHTIPRAELILVDNKEAAAIHMLPFTWKNLDSVKAEDANAPTAALEPYRMSGELFKWAILDYVLGNADRHGANLMVSTKDDGYKVALIDHGSAFAGPSFNPSQDKESWIPYYLRCWSSIKWKELSLQDRLKKMPSMPKEREQDVFQWVMSIDPMVIGQVMQRYSIVAQPSLDRLAKIKSCKERIDVHVCKLWLGLI